MLLTKGRDTTPEAFSRQVISGTLFKSLHINENLHLSCQVPLSNIILRIRLGAIFPIITCMLFFVLVVLG